MTPHPAEITCENAFKYRASTVNRALQAPLSGAPIEAAQLAKLVWEISDPATHEAIREVIYARTLFQLQCELVKLQRWVHAKKLKIVVIFEGRDAAGASPIGSTRDSAESAVYGLFRTGYLTARGAIPLYAGWMMSLPLWSDKVLARRRAQA